MKGFASFVKKEILHILRDRRTMLIVLLMPAVLMLLFGFAISTEVNNIDVAAVVPKRSEEVRKALERISINPYFTYKGTVSQMDAESCLRSGFADAVVVFAPDFGVPAEARTDRRPKVQIMFDASNSNDAQTGEWYLRGVLAGESLAAAMPETRMLYNPQMKSAYNFVPGIMGLIFILICAIMTSVSIVREKENGTMEVLLVSPVRPLRIILAKMIPYFLLSCINLATIMLLARFALGMPMAGSAAGTVGLSMLYVVLALALGLFISTIADKQATALIISAMLMLLPVIMLSGMIFPIENMPEILQFVSCFIPARWYIDGLRKLMIEGLPFAEVMKEFLILLAMTAAIMAMSLKKFNDKLE